MSHGRIESIQVMRGCAAMAVVFHHACRAVTLKFPTNVHLIAATPVTTSFLVPMGATGVDLFFVLSGFLMVYISGPYRAGRPISDFLVHRAIRIWPLYVLVTLALCALMTVHTGLSNPDLQPHRFLGLLFIPTFDYAGMIHPILGVGWTLNYEALFYLVFAAALLFRSTFIALFAILAAVMGTGWLLPASWAFHDFLGNTIIIEFCYGVLIALCLDRLPIRWPLPWMILGAGLLLLHPATIEFGDHFRFIRQGIGAAMLFIGVLRMYGPWPSWLLALGNASYSLYLVHNVVIYYAMAPLARRAARYLTFTGSTEACALLCIAASVIAGFLCYRLFERPLTGYLRELVSARSVRTAR